jgi:hypothetical protein
VNYGGKEKIEENDFKSCWGRDEERSKRKGGKEGHCLKKEHCEDVVDVDQNGSEGIEEEGKKGSEKTKRNDEEAHIRDEEKIGQKSNRRYSVEMERNKGRCPQNRYGSNEKRKSNIFQNRPCPRGF